MFEEWYLIQSPYYTNKEEKTNFRYDRDLGIEDILTDTPLSSDIYLCKGKFDGVNFETEIGIKGIVQSNDSDSMIKSWERQLIEPIGLIKDYQYVKYQNSIWLIMNKPNNNKFYEKVTLNLCNWIAKWQDDDSNVIYKPFVIQNASQFNNGIVKNKTISIGYNQFMVYACLDDDTLGLHRDKRMFIDYNTKTPTPYKLTRPDSVSFSSGDDRVIAFIFTEDQLNEQTDRIDLMLCDYTTPKQSYGQIQILYNGQAQIRCGGKAKTFSVLIDDVVEWELKLLDSQKDTIVLTEMENNKCKIQCLSHKALIGSSFKLIAKTEHCTSELLIDVVGGV